MDAGLNAQRKQQWSWALYDWANSAFATTVLAGFFPIFFKQYSAGGLAATQSTFYLGLFSSLASIVVMIASPLLGAAADQGGKHKRYLLIFTVIGVLATALLPLAGQGQWLFAGSLFCVASIGFFGGLTFYDSLLVSVATPAQSDRVSALGYGAGYLGGGVLLAANVAMTLKPGLFGLADAGEAVKWSFVSVALWWALFAIPLFRSVPDTPALSQRASAWAGLLGTIAELRKHRHIALFLLAYWLYIDGVHTIIRMAVDFGLSLGFDSNSLIKALLLVQFIGFPAAIVFGRLGERWGTKRSILLAIGIYALVTLWGYGLQTESQFYAMAAAIGCVQGGIQSLSRSWFARLVPAERAGSFFGVYNMMGKFAAVLGPLLVGITAALLDSTRLSILSILVLFVAGAALLWRVPDPRN